MVPRDDWQVLTGQTVLCAGVPNSLSILQQQDNFKAVIMMAESTILTSERFILGQPSRGKFGKPHASSLRFFLASRVLRK